jgi:palmitoyltransferase ZDHHC9/14/18
MFVSSATVLCAFVFAFCWIFIKESAKNENKSVWKALIDNPASIVLIIYTFISVWFVGGLTFFHLYLICSNQTTYENFRAHYDQRVNVHDKGVVENLKQVFCIRVPPSKHKLRAKVDREAVIPPRSGYASPNTTGKPTGESDGSRTKVIWNEDGEQGQLSGDFADLSQNLGGARGSRRSGSWDLHTDVESGFGDSNRMRSVL